MNTDNPPSQPRTCGHCIRMIDGFCYANPPVVFSNGFAARPPVRHHDPACAHFVLASPVAALSADCPGLTDAQCQ